MLLTFEKGIRGGGGMYQAIYIYAKANNKYMNNYDKNKETPYLEHVDANNLYRWAMSQKLPIGNSEWIKKMINQNLIKNS